jgi:hypothetical protein
MYSSQKRLTYFQGPHLKPGYRGTEYQILTLIVELLNSLNQNNDTHGLLEVANTGILDDVVLVTYSDKKVARAVKALQIKYYEKKIDRPLLNPGADIGIDKFFIGYLALREQYPQADLITMLYTNTDLANNVSIQAKESYCIINENWSRDCREVAIGYLASIPKSFFQKISSFVSIQTTDQIVH